MAKMSQQSKKRSANQQKSALNCPNRQCEERHKQQQKQRLNVIRRGQRGQYPANPPNLAYLRRLVVSENQILRQMLFAWLPLLNCRCVGRLLLISSLILIPLGTLLLITGMHAKDFHFPYGEECKSSRNYLRILRRSCIFCGGGFSPTCSKEIYIPEGVKTPVYMYYEVENFHQNHRFMIKSMDNSQLQGKIFSGDPSIPGEQVPVVPSTSCSPYSTDDEGKIYFPCGSMANAMFTDEFVLRTGKGYVVPLRTANIANPILKRFKFRNSFYVSPKNYNYKRMFTTNFVKPKAWTTAIWDEWWQNGGLENDRFINWMTPSHSPTFRKLYAVIDSVPHCPQGIFCKGNYTIQIQYRYDVDSFKGKKAIILSVHSFFGSRNLFLSISVFLIGFGNAMIGFRLLKTEVYWEQVRQPKKNVPENSSVTTENVERQNLLRKEKKHRHPHGHRKGPGERKVKGESSQKNNTFADGNVDKAPHNVDVLYKNSTQEDQKENKTLPRSSSSTIDSADSDSDVSSSTNASGFLFVN